jgi:hypothetical protein
VLLFLSAGDLGYTAAAVLSEEQLPQYGRSFRQLQVEVTPETASRLHIKIKPKGVTRWEVPEYIVQRYVALAGESAFLLPFLLGGGV